MKMNERVAVFAEQSPRQTTGCSSLAGVNLPAGTLGG
jgi:hypothetical protein